jgi:outer membrane protein assembly factor BamB
MITSAQRAVGSLIAAFAALGCSDPPPAPRSETVKLLWRTEEVAGETVPVFDATAVYNLEAETHTVSAVRKTDGTLIWKKPLRISDPAFGGSGLALAAGVLVVGDLDLFGLEPTSGDILWQFIPSEGRNPGYSSLTAVGSTIYAASTTGHLYAIDAATGTQRWAREFNTQVPTLVYNPRVVDGVIYAAFTYRPATGPHQGGAVAVDTAGNVIWKFFTPRATASTFTEVTNPIAVTATEAIVGDNIGAYFLNRSTGALVKSLTAADFGESGGEHTPLVAGNMVIVGVAASKVFAFDAVTHAKVWQRFVGASVWSMASAGDYIYVALLGPFNVLRVSDGTVVWSLDTGFGAEREDYLRAPAIEGNTFYLPGTRSVRALRIVSVH